MQRVFIMAVAAATFGCTVNSGNESFVIQNNLAVQGDTCDFTATLTSPSLPRGQLFLDSPIPYVLTPLLVSRVTAAEGRESLRTIQVQGARIDLEIGPIESIDAAGAVTIDDTVDTLQFESLFATALTPNGGTAFGTFDIVPLSALELIRARATAGARVHAQAVATMRAFGDFYGQEIQSEPFRYPVTVCSDCVARPINTCNRITPTTMVRPGNPCNPFQDGIVDCCMSETLGLVCPATPETTP
ncbi:MAG: hypothetical protein KF773_38480 [Deltaproteobacteria bacterium]|nr:hypothetical protein [Deltaproteobacteria bacterium]MCW5809169.1 hypothetical protein [Deltaproteobacteria bacterium]